MILINLQTHDPFFYLALEEVLLKQTKSDYLILGINDPSVIIGKHQVAHREVNTRFVTENDIPVIRRISGGGTVFHDAGNLNFTFIRQSEEGKQVDFRKYTMPVIDFLISLGTDARLEGKNDIRVDGLKISGNAEHVHHNRVLHHGTLLFSASMESLKQSIRNDKSCYETRAVGSNPSSVINLNEKLSGFRDINDFRNGMIKYFSGIMPGLELHEVSPEHSEAAEALAKTKFRSWDWNFAYGPDYVFKNNFLFENSPHLVTLKVSSGIVMQCAFEGSGKLILIAEKLRGCRHMVPDILSVFEKEKIELPEGEIFNFF
jgi:lipoate-protein ligase A